MAGISGVISTGLPLPEQQRFLESIGQVSQASVRRVPALSASLAAAGPEASRKSRRIIAEPGFTLVLAGQVISEQEIVWSQLVDALRHGNFTALAHLSGRFAIACLDEMDEALYLITDRLAQFPLYVAQTGQDFFFSTSQGSFCTLDRAPPINPAWFVEFFLANFSASHQSFLSGVERLPPATVLRRALRTGGETRLEYAPRYQARQSLVAAAEEVARAKAIFAKRMPLYLKPGERGVAGLSSGFDSRTILAYFAAHPEFAVYTYGVPECEDAVAAAALSVELGIPHAAIPFAREFEAKLPELMLRTVWLSSGLQSCLRATLTHAYQNVGRLYPDADAILSGDSGDQLLRGHGNVPSIVSRAVDELFRTGQYPATLPGECMSMFREDVPAWETMTALKERLSARYGDVRSTAAHLGYLAYETPAEYFSGEASIADQYVDFRTPFCDRDVVDFAFSSNLSTLTFSRFGSYGKDGLAKNYLPAHLVASNEALAQWPIHGKPLDVFTGRKRTRYVTSAVLGRVARRLAPGRKSAAPLEDWPRWFGMAWPMISTLLKNDARVESLVNRRFIDHVLSTREVFWLNKLLTSEIILRLKENAWSLAPVLEDVRATAPATAASKAG